jgi:hypothetical protein
VQDIEVQNKCLLSKWIFKLMNEDRLWQQIIRKKIPHKPNIGTGSKETG